MSDATDCIIQETLTYEEVMKRWGNNPNFKNIDKIKDRKSFNQDEPYPMNPTSN